MNKKSILDMAMGAFRERADYEMSKVVDNILDPNTSATKRRSLTITMTFQPDSQRQNISTSTVVKAKLEPTDPVSTSLYISGNENGSPIIVEMVPQVPGQIAMDGSEQEEPAVLRLVKNA